MDGGNTVHIVTEIQLSTRIWCISLVCNAMADHEVDLLLVNACSMDFHVFYIELINVIQCMHWFSIYKKTSFLYISMYSKEWIIPCLPSLAAPNTALTSFLGHLTFVTQHTAPQHRCHWRHWDGRLRSLKRSLKRLVKKVLKKGP